DIVLFFIFSFIVGLLGAFTAWKLLQSDVEGANDKFPFTNQEKVTQLDEDLNMVKQAYELINQHYIEDVDREELIEGAIQGMLDTLEDPYSSYMNAEAMERFQEQIQSSFQGIGAEVSMVEGKLTIVS